MIGFDSKVDATGIDLFVSGSTEITRARMVDAVTGATMHLDLRLKERLSGGRAGRKYFVPGVNLTTLKSGQIRGVTYTASAPGEAPARATSSLVQAIVRTPTVSLRDGDEARGDVGADGNRAPHARRMEYGGVSVVPRDVSIPIPDVGWRRVKAGTVIRVAPRPFVRPTFDAEREPAIRIMREIVTGGGGSVQAETGA